METKKGGLVGSSLIIAGTCIGGGMLALPSATAASGFAPSLAAHLASWLFMLVTGLLLMEACLWLPSAEGHMPSLAETFLGRPGKWVTCLLFIFLYYCLMISYISGGSPYIARFLSYISQESNVPASLPIGLYVALLGSVIFLGRRAVDRVNLILVLGLFGAFAALLLVGTGAVSPENLAYTNWSKAPLSAPILFGAYGYHNVVPSLVSYLKQDKRTLRSAILLGTLVPLVVYCLWQAVALGVVPPLVLQAASGSTGIPIVEAIIGMTDSPWLVSIVYLFSFFAIVTSILGVAFSMVDFLRDGLQLGQGRASRLVLSTLTLLPPALVALWRPNLFVEVFALASGFGETILNGLIPIAIFWVGLKHLGHQPKLPLLRSRAMLLGLTLAALTVLGIEIWQVLTP